MRKTIKKQSIHHLPALAAITLFCFPAYAQQQKEAQLPEVRVTSPTAKSPGNYVSTETSAGALGERSLQETPFSVNVITRELIEDQQAAYLGDYLKNDPSAVVGNVPVGFLTLRGFVVGTDGFLYDGMPGNLGLQDGRGQLEGVDRIEILKGAGSFLYGQGGASSLGGTLNFIPKRATSEPVRSISVDYTTKSLLGMHADFGNRFGENQQFGYRFNLALKNGEQALEGYDWKHQVGTMAFDWRATENLLLTANYEAFDNNLPRLQPFFVLAPGVAVPKAPDASRNIAMSWDNFEVRSRNTHLKAEWAFTTDWMLTAQALHATNKRPPTKEARFGFILDNAGNTALFGDQGAYDTVDNSQQLRINGKLSMGGLRHEVAAGVSSFREKTRLSDNAGLGAFMTNIYAPVDSPEPANAVFTTGVSQRLEASSVFASDIVSFSEQWSVLVGARRAKLSVETFNVTTGAVTGGSSIEKTTPTTALMYKPSRDSLLYITYAEGLEQGGTAPVGTANANQRLGPMVTEQVEIGGKTNIGDLALTAAVFDMKKPLEVVDPTTNLYTQSGQQRHRGLEFTGTGKVMRDFTLVAGTMLLDPTASGTGVPANDGRKPVGVPRSTANVWGVYRTAMPGLSINAGVFHSSAQYADAANTLEVPAWTRFDAGLRYDTRAGGKKVSYLLSIENLADRSYWTGAQTGLLVLSNPRTLKLAAKIDL